MASPPANYGSNGPSAHHAPKEPVSARSSWPSVASAALGMLTWTACAVTCYCIAHASWIDTYSFGPDGTYHHTVRIGLWAVCYERMQEHATLKPACTKVRFTDFLLVTQICECIATGSSCIAVALTILQLARSGLSRLRVYTRRFKEDMGKLMVLCHFIAVVSLLICLPLFLTAARLEGVELSVVHSPPPSVLPYDIVPIKSVPSTASSSPSLRVVGVGEPGAESRQHAALNESQRKLDELANGSLSLNITALPPNVTPTDLQWQHLPAFSVFSFAVWFQCSGLALNAASLGLAIKQHTKGRKRKRVQQQELEVRPRSESRRVLFRQTSQLSMDAFPPSD